MLGNYSEIIGSYISLTLKFLKSTKASSNVTINKKFLFIWLLMKK